MAAQLQVRTWDPACRTAHYQQDIKDLQCALSSPGQPINRWRWQDWYDRSFALTLERNHKHFTEHICSIKELCKDQDEDG